MSTSILHTPISQLLAKLGWGTKTALGGTLAAGATATVIWLNPWETTPPAPEIESARLPIPLIPVEQAHLSPHNLLRFVADHEESPLFKVETLGMLSASLHQAGEIQEANWCFARAVQVIQQMTLTDYADLHLQLAAHWQQTGHHVKTRALCQKVDRRLRRALAENHGDPPEWLALKARALAGLGMDEQARHACRQALYTYHAKKYDPRRDDLYVPTRQLTRTLYLLGQPAKARPLLDILSDDYAYFIQLDIASDLLLNRRMNDAKEVIGHLRRLAEKVRGPAEKVGRLSNITHLLIAIGDTKTALQFADQALHLMPKIADPGFAAQYNFDLAISYERLGQPDKARDIALRTNHSTNRREQLIGVARSLAQQPATAEFTTLAKAQFTTAEQTLARKLVLDVQATKGRP